MYGNIEIIEDATLNMDNSNASLHIIPRTTEAASCSQTENQPITNVKKKCKYPIENYSRITHIKLFM